MDHFIESVLATADSVRAELHHKKRINISFDEWNVWYITRYRNDEQITDVGNWPTAPRILEQRYSVLDGVVVGNLLISLLKHADRVTSASMAQLVNAIAPIMTEPGGDAWRQTTFLPFAVTSRLAVGSSLLVKLESDTYQTDLHGEVPTTPSSQAIAIRTRRRPGSSSDSQRGSLRTRWARASRLALSRRQRWPGRRP